jgi:hypothetical protein
MNVPNAISGQPDRRPVADSGLGDLRFRALLSDDDWAELPLPVRRRFSKRLADGNTVVYVGEVTEAWFSRAGFLLAQLARLIGGPLPTARDTRIPSVVTVTEDMATGGQIWTRLYARRNKFPQVIHSSKRFAGPTGLEEHVGCGVGMTLRVLVENHALTFRSERYFVQCGGLRFALPAWASPGVLTVAHTEIGEGRFMFSLDVTHPHFGPLIRQSAIFQEAAP